MRDLFIKNYMRSSVFESSDGEIFEFENILKIHNQHESLLTINLYAGVNVQLTSPSDIEMFKIWYNIFLETKYGEKFDEVEGKDLL